MAQSRSPKPTTESDVPEVMSEKELARAMGGEIVSTTNVNTPTYSATDLKNITTWDEIADVLESAGVEVEFADQVLGDGFSVLSTEDKSRYVGVPMMLLEWRFNQGTQGEFASMRAIAKTGPNPSDIAKLIINDGSTGIMRQLKEYTADRGRQGGLLIRRGLRVSEYTYTDNNGQERPAKTFYLDASA